MDNEYSDKKQAEILSGIEKWSTECRTLPLYNELNASDKENFDFITSVFGDFMYGYYLQEPNKWTATALEYVLIDIFPRKMIVQDSLYDSVEPVLSIFFGYLNQIGVLKNYKSLCSKLKPSSKEMRRRAKSADNASPIKQLLMEGMEQGIDPSDTDALNAILNAGKVSPFTKPESIGGKKAQAKKAATSQPISSEIINEPTLEQWSALYEVAKHIQLLEPWNFLWDSYIITIMLPDYEEPVYCSVMGRSGECYGVAVYIGYEGFLSYQRLANAPMDEPPFISGFEQKCIMCNFGDRDEITPKDRKIMKALDLRFRGKNQWFFFRSMKPGYYPWHINSNEAVLLTLALQNLAMALTHYVKGDLKVDFDGGETLLRYYSPEKELWLNTASNRTTVVVERLEIVVDDATLLARLKKQKCNNALLELEVLYLPTPIQENKDEKPYLPRMILLADKMRGLPIDQYMAEKDEDIEDEIINMLANYVERFGRPKSINVRDDRTARYISDFCRKIGVKLIESQGVASIDNLLMGMLEFMG